MKEIAYSQWVKDIAYSLWVKEIPYSQWVKDIAICGQRRFCVGEGDSLFSVGKDIAILCR